MSMFKLFTRSEPKAEPSWYVLETADGLQLQPLATQAGRPLTAPLLGPVGHVLAKLSRFQRTIVALSLLGVGQCLIGSGNFGKIHAAAG